MRSVDKAKARAKAYNKRVEKAPPKPKKKHSTRFRK